MRATTRLTLAVLLVTVVVLGAATATPWHLNPPQLPTPELTMPALRPPNGVSSPSPTPQPIDDPGTTPGWITLVLTLLIGLLAATLLTLTARKLLTLYRQRTRTTPDNLTAGTTTGTPGDDVDLPELQDAVTRALAHLDGHARPRDAVVAAWVALEEAAERAGTHRNPAQTATEFAGAVLAATPAPPTAVARLRTLYHRARFTDRPIDREDVHQARAALADIARSLAITEIAVDPTTDPTAGPNSSQDNSRGPA